MAIQTRESARLQIGDLVLDIGQRRVFRDDHPLDLPKLSFQLLHELAKVAPNVLTQDELMELVWPNGVIAPETLTQRVKLLRQAIGDDARQPRYIGLVWGEGYRLLVPVHRVSVGEDLSAIPATDIEINNGARAQRRQREAGVAAIKSIRVGALVLGLALCLVVYFVAERYVQTNVAESVTPPATELSVAVLPFVNMSTDPDQEYFADGISEELLNVLAQIRELRVTGRTSSFAFKGLNEDLRVIGEKLNVVYVLEGSVRKSGQTVRITAQLVNADDGYQVWSDTFDRDLTDIFAIQDDIARSVASALSVSLGVGEGDLSQGGTRNLDAYDVYLEALSLLRQEGEISSNSVIPAIALLEKAVALDPNYAKAWALLAGLNYNVATFIEPNSTDELLLQKQAAARQRVIEIAPESITALIYASQRHARNHHWIAAEQSLRRALEQTPSDLEVNNAYMILLTTVGRLGDALTYAHRTRQIEPLLFWPNFNTALRYRISGKTDLAMRYFEEAQEKFDNTWLPYLGIMVVGMETRDSDLIRQMAKRLLAFEDLPTDARLLITTLVPLMDSPEAAVGELHRLSTDPAFDAGATGVTWAYWAAYFGDPDLSLKIFQERGGIGASWDPVFKDMRRLPAFKTYVQETGLVEYWRSTGNWGENCRPLGAEDFECD